MNKDFNDFVELMNNKDWSLVAEKLVRDIQQSASTGDLGNSIAAFTNANMQFTLQLLSEYHNWLNS